MVALSDKDKEMLAGKRGEAAQLAMSILVRMAGVYGAEEMMDITQAHLDVVHYEGEASLEIPERLAAMGATFAVPTTLNTTSMDLENWQSFDVPEDYAVKVKRMEAAFLKMGGIPTWTCAPYQGCLTPRFGQQIAWAESNAINYINSVVGARTNRYGDYMEVCAAITGRVPKCGLHLKENRKGQVLLRIVDVDPSLLATDAFYPVLGYLVGNLVQDKIPVIEGVPPEVSKDQLKALSAAAASSGAVPLFHVVGVTPEASTVAEAFQGDRPKQIIELRHAELSAAREELSTTQDGKLDAVVLGCPHYSVIQLRQLAQMVGEKHIHPGVQFIVITNRAALCLLEGSSVLDVLRSFGASLMLDGCVLNGPVISSEAKVMMTDSGKCAYYGPGILGLEVAFGSVADCVRSAVEARICQEESSWIKS